MNQAKGTTDDYGKCTGFLQRISPPIDFYRSVALTILELLAFNVENI